SRLTDSKLRLRPRRLRASREVKSRRSRRSVLEVDRDENEQEGRQPDQVQGALFLGRNLSKRDDALANSQKRKRKCEGQEQLVASSSPEAHEEEAAREEAECRCAREEVVKNQRSVLLDPVDESEQQRAACRK